MSHREWDANIHIIPFSNMRDKVYGRYTSEASEREFSSVKHEENRCERAERTTRIGLYIVLADRSERVERKS